MRFSKITITLQVDQVRAIQELVAAGKASSVSGFVQHAVGVSLFDAAGWQTMLEDALQQTGGPLTNQERVWADGVLHTHQDSHEDPHEGSGSSQGRNKAA